MLDHFKEFPIHIDYELYIAGDDVIYPNACYCIFEDEVHLNQLLYDVSVYGDYENTNLDSSYIMHNEYSFNKNVIPKPGYVVTDVSYYMDNSTYNHMEFVNNPSININSVINNVSVNIETDTFIVDGSMFFNRETGNGCLILNNKAKLNNIKGNTLDWNQKIDLTSYANNVGFIDISTYDILRLQIDDTVDDCRRTWFIGDSLHKYYYYSQIQVNDINTNSAKFSFRGTNNSTNIGTLLSEFVDVSVNKYYTLKGITTGYKYFLFYMPTSDNYRLTTDASVNLRYFNVIDLTEMFGVGYEPNLYEISLIFSNRIHYDYISENITLNNSMIVFNSKRYNGTGVEPTLSSKTNWVYVLDDTRQIIPVDGIFSIEKTSNTTYITLRASNYNRFNNKALHKHYCRAFVNTSMGSSFGWGNYGGGFIASPLKNDGTYEKASKFYTSLASISRNRPEIRVLNIGGSDTNGIVVKVKEPIVIDLTEMFGTVLAEELTLEQCDAIFNDLAGYIDTNIFNNYNLLLTINLPITELTGKLNNEGESIVIFADGMKKSFDNTLQNFVYDEIKFVNDKWTAYKRISSVKSGVKNSYTNRYEYNILSDELIYILDNQNIPHDIVVATYGCEEITPALETTPTTAPAIMNIQYGSLSLHCFRKNDMTWVTGNYLEGTNNNMIYTTYANVCSNPINIPEGSTKIIIYFNFIEPDTTYHFSFLQLNSNGLFINKEDISDDYDNYNTGFVMNIVENAVSFVILIYDKPSLTYVQNNLYLFVYFK